MEAHLQRRVIGETPPSLGGIQAYAYISPNWKGECLMRYEIDGFELVARFPDYRTARTAAIRGIFSEEHNIRAVRLHGVGEGDTNTPLYAGAGQWLSSLSFNTLEKVVGL